MHADLWHGRPHSGTGSEPIPGQGDGAQDWFGTIQDISDIRKAEEELRRSEQRFRTLTDNLPGVVYRRIVTSDGEVRDIYVSPRVKELLGVDAAEFTSGRARLNDFLHPDDRDKKLTALHEAAESRCSLFRIEVRKIVRPSGEVRWWQVHSMPVQIAGWDPFNSTASPSISPSGARSKSS